MEKEKIMYNNSKQTCAKFKFYCQKKQKKLELRMFEE